MHNYPLLLSRLKSLLWPLFLLATIFMACSGEMSSHAKSGEKPSDTLAAADDHDNMWNNPYSKGLSQVEYLPVDSRHRTLFDTCIAKRDTLESQHRQIHLTEYWLFPNLITKDALSNYSFYCYQWGDTVLCYSSSPMHKQIIVNTKKKLSILNFEAMDEREEFKELAYNLRVDIDTLLKFKDIALRHFPIAEYDKEGIDANKSNGSWQTNFKKQYTEKGVLLTNIDGRKFTYLIKYPFHLKTGKGKEVIKRRAEKLPLFLFTDMIDYLYIFALQRTFNEEFNPPDFSAYDE